MSKNIKIISTSDSGGVLDQAILIERKLKSKGYNSSVIKVSKLKKKIINKIKFGDYVIFHMSAYGYQKKGIPLWLINEIKSIKKKSSCLVIHFHELNVNKKIWDPRFIVMILQKYINIQLLKYCDFWITSNIQYANWLNKHSSQKKNFICPVISNIDQRFIKVKKNKKLVIIFGTAETREQIYKKNFHSLNEWINNNQLYIFDIGPKIKNLTVRKLINTNKRIKVFGKLDSIQIRNLFSQAYLGLFSKPENLVCKSTILATYGDFKVCPINLEDMNNKNSVSLKTKRYLRFLPNKKSDDKIIKKICKFNLEFSKKNNMEKYLRAYLAKY